MEKTLWEISKETSRVPMIEVYSAILKEAGKYREDAKSSRKDEEPQYTYAGLCDEVASALYKACAALENTEEINPTNQ